MRRYKACDPFSKSHGKKKEDKKNNLPPKGKDCVKDVHFEETYKVKRVNEMLELGKNKGKKTKQQKELAKQIGKQLSGKAMKKKQTADNQRKEDLKMKQGETRKEFFNRLDNKVQQAVGKVMEESKPLRKKRKKHLQARDEKLKQEKKMKSGEKVDEIKEFKDLKDDVSFGDVAMRPPEFSAKPRKTPVNKTKTFHFSSLVDKASEEDKDGESAENTQKDKPKTKDSLGNDKKEITKRKDMSAGGKLRFDAERQKAIDAYRSIKKRKEDLKNIASAKSTT